MQQANGLNLFGNEPGATRLMAGAQTGAAAVTVEILGEQQMIPPEGVGLKFGGAFIDRAPPVLVFQSFICFFADLMKRPNALSLCRLST